MSPSESSGPGPGGGSGGGRGAGCNIGGGSGGGRGAGWLPGGGIGVGGACRAREAAVRPAVCPRGGAALGGRRGAGRRDGRSAVARFSNNTPVSLWMMAGDGRWFRGPARGARARESQAQKKTASALYQAKQARKAWHEEEENTSTQDTGAHHKFHKPQARQGGLHPTNVYHTRARKQMWSAVRWQ